MRVTSTMKDYIRDCVKKKVADKLVEAKKAWKDQNEKDSKALKAIEDYAKSLIPEATKKVAAFAKKQGLTWISENVPSYRGIIENVNIAFSPAVSAYNFKETNSYDCNEYAERKMRKELMEEPRRIENAVDRAVNSIVFSLELGKVKKAELEELIASTEVEV